MNTIRTNSWARVAVNENVGTRKTIGNLLRVLADYIDQRDSMAVEILTLPPLNAQQRIQCMDEGTRAIIAAVRSEAEHEALESIMQDYCRRLYPDNHDA
jgi:hypothetical protein